jgi:hypothetical protein
MSDKDREIRISPLLKQAISLENEAMAWRCLGAFFYPKALESRARDKREEAETLRLHQNLLSRRSTEVRT